MQTTSSPNRIRSIMRLFSSEVEDKAWWYDREFWREYLAMLAEYKFNRFNLALGLGYDFPRRIDDSYLYFSYPFLLAVPGFNVRANPLPDEERDRNLDALRFIAEETVRNGLHFQLGLWTHAYEFQDSPDVNYTIEGLTAETHAPYCRAAVCTLLQAVPQIGGVTLRIHGESGVAEGSYDFWREVFTGAAECGRRVELDLHSKGIDQQMIDAALQVARDVGGGLPVNVSPKYWAEHLGLPYHQAWIRPTEQTLRPGRWEQRFMTLSDGTRRFTRYGYADLLPEDRRYGVLWRVWPGTQRLLLWGDPVFAAGYGRAAHFAGTDGMEWFEPLSFKGRKGSGLPGLGGQRTGYADAALLPEGGAAAGWKKYRHTYYLLGRYLHDPDAGTGGRNGWRDSLRDELGAAADDAGEALACASRILPLVTSAHLPSAANYGLWVELPTNMPIVSLADAGAAVAGQETRPQPYGDTPVPKRFGTVSPLDPQLFSTPDECATALVEGQPDGRYSPLEVAMWLDQLTARALERLEAAEHQAGNPPSPAFRRLAVDVRIQAGLGRYWGEKLRAGVAYAVFKHTGAVDALQEALSAYRRARDGWAAAAGAGRVYASDLTFGPVPYLRGHWADRLPGIDQDISDMEHVLRQAEGHPAEAAEPQSDGVDRWRAAWQRPSAARAALPEVLHSPVATFQPGQALAVECHLAEAGQPGASQRTEPLAVRLHYRQVSQAEPWQSLDLAAGAGGTHMGEIPATYTDTRYPLQYYFEVRGERGARLWPGFTADLANQPYFVVRRA